MASKIDRGQAQSLIQEYRNQNKAAGEHAWKTPDGKHLNGFFIDRESLENILADKKNVGINVHFAKHPDFAGKSDKVHTLVYSGSAPNNAPGATSKFVSNSEMYGGPEPCPPWCNS